MIGIMAALLARQNTGLGQYIDAAMADGLLSWMSSQIGAADYPAQREAGDPGYGVFRAGDGGLFTLGIAHEDWF